MITAAESLSINWIRVLDMAKKGGALAMAFALGGWVVSIRAQEARQPYLQRSAVQLEQVKKITGANPVANVKCLKRQGAVATDVAAQAVAVAEDNNGYPPLPDLNRIPFCPPAPAAK